MQTIKTVFRYPGGKSKLAETIVNRIEDLILVRPSGDFFSSVSGSKNSLCFVDVFAGGGSVALSFLHRHKATIYLNDLDKNMMAFWSCFKDIDSEDKLIELIKATKPTIDNFEFWKGRFDYFKTPWEIGFAALFINRTAFSGILSSGPIGGYDQKGKYKIGCRYNPKRLIENIRKIGKVLRENNFVVTNFDFRDVIREFGKRENTILYLDPPYMEQGDQLYRHWMLEQDYIDMRDMLKEAKCKWVLSHDMNEKFLTMYKDWANIETIEGVPYTINSIKNKRRIELLITPKQ